MTEAVPTTVWLACPKCEWRREFPRGAVPAGTRCRQCGTVIVLSPSPEIRSLLPQGVISLEPVELPPPSGVQHVMTRNHDDVQLAPASAPMPPPILPSTVPRGSVQIETEHEDVVRPPRNASIYWAFTNNIFDFPFRFPALSQWIIASLGLALSEESTLLGAMGFMSMSVAGAIQGCMFTVAGCILSLFTLSYLTGCFIDITVNAAYNIDKSYDWPSSEMRDRVVFMLRVVWVGAMTGAMAAAVAGICSFAGDCFTPMLIIVFTLLFPVLILAGLESDSLFWPVSWPVFRSLRIAAPAWLIFYFITGTLGFACGLLTVALYHHSPLQMPFLAGPVVVTAIFIYARLLGRLAWFILHKTTSYEENKTARRSAEHERWKI